MRAARAHARPTPVEQQSGRSPRRSPAAVGPGEAGARRRGQDAPRRSISTSKGSSSWRGPGRRASSSATIAARSGRRRQRARGIRRRCRVQSLAGRSVCSLGEGGRIQKSGGLCKPLPNRPASHFGSEDAMDRILERIMAEHNVKPESVERRVEYLEELRAFAGARRVGRWSASEAPLRRRGMEVKMELLRSALRAYDDASIKDHSRTTCPSSSCPRCDCSTTRSRTQRRGARGGRAADGRPRVTKG